MRLALSFHLVQKFRSLNICQSCNCMNMAEDTTDKENDLEGIQEDVDAEPSEDTSVVTSTVETENANVVAKRSGNGGRFRWKFHTINLHKDACGEATKSYHNPFLVDNNFKDLVYSENLVAHNPMRAAYMGKGAAMQTFYDAAKSACYGGVAPLQSKSRITAYKQLAEYWTDKTGPVTPDGLHINVDEMKRYRDMSVREKIVYNVDAFISEMKENEQKEKLAETEKAHVQKKEESAISKIKNTALGALIDLTPITSEDNEDDDNGNVGKGVSLKTKN